jgi:hypothetical protein
MIAVLGSDNLAEIVIDLEFQSLLLEVAQCCVAAFSPPWY